MLPVITLLIILRVPYYPLLLCMAHYTTERHLFFLLQMTAHGSYTSSALKNSARVTWNVPWMDLLSLSPKAVRALRQINSNYVSDIVEEFYTVVI